MKEEILKVLAVADPAVSAYTEEKYEVLKNYGKKVQFDAVPWADYIRTMSEVFAGKAQYDIIMVAGHLWLCDFVNKGYLEELHYDDSDILPDIMKEMRYQGKTYLSPSFFDGHIVVYRKSVVKEILGKEFPEVITPQEYLDAARKIAAVLKRPAVSMKADVSEILVDALPFMRMYGKDVYEGELHTPVCDDEKVVAGLKEYLTLRSLALPGVGKFGNEEVAEAIRKNAVPLAMTWSGQMGVIYTEECIEKEDLGFSTITTPWNVSWAFAISSNSDKKEEAREFLAYLRSKEVDKIAGKVCGAPVRISNYEGSDVMPWFACQLEMTKRAVTLPDMPEAGSKNGILYEKAAEAFSGIKTAEEAMKEAKIAIENV